MGATAPAPATALNEPTALCDPANADSAKTTATADSTRAADKAQTPATEPPHTHDDAQVISGTKAATDASAGATDEPSQPKSSAPQLPSVLKRIGPVNLYTQHNLHKLDLTLITDEASWEVLVKQLNKQQKNELLDNMAAFIISLPDVDTHIDDKKIFTPTHREITTLIDDMLARTAQLAEIPDFINPITVQPDSYACTYHGRGLCKIKNILDGQLETSLQLLQLHHLHVASCMAPSANRHCCNAHGVPHHSPQSQHAVPGPHCVYTRLCTAASSTDTIHQRRQQAQEQERRCVSAIVFRT
jgi:hypothetical protein